MTPKICTGGWPPVIGPSFGAMSTSLLCRRTLVQNGPSPFRYKVKSAPMETTPSPRLDAKKTLKFFFCGLSEFLYFNKENSSNHQNTYVFIWFLTLPKPYLFIGIGPFPNKNNKKCPEMYAHIGRGVKSLTR